MPDQLPTDVYSADGWIQRHGSSAFRQLTGRDVADPAKDRALALESARFELAARNQYLQELKAAKDFRQDAVEQQERERMLIEAAKATDEVANINPESNTFDDDILKLGIKYGSGIRDPRLQDYIKGQSLRHTQWMAKTNALDEFQKKRDAEKTARDAAQAEKKVISDAAISQKMGGNETTRTVYTQYGQTTLTNPEAKEDKDKNDRARLGELESLLSKKDLDPDVQAAAKPEYLALRQKLGLNSGAPALTPELKTSLESAHQLLEDKLKSLSGFSFTGSHADEKAELINRINPIKAQLGYQTLDANGQPVAAPTVPVSAPATPVAAPAGTPAPATSPDTGASAKDAPELTSKDQFDALPSGSEYIRNGERYRKP